MSSRFEPGSPDVCFAWLTPWRLGLGLAVMLFAVFPGVLLGTDSFYFRDYGVLGYPFMHHARESFWRGELPFWNPLSNCGAPFLAQWGTMALYPFSLIYLLLPMPWSLSVFCFMHLVFGGVGMAQLARGWTRHPLAAAIAGTAFVFNGFTFSCLVWPNYLVALGWMPWVVMAVERAWLRGRGWVVAAGLAAALQLLSGVPEIILLTWLALVWIGAADFLSGVVPRGKLLARMLVVVVLAAGVAAAQLLPFFDLLQHSQREYGAMTSKWAMPGWGWANLLVPLFHCFQTPEGQFFQYGQEFLPSYYLGAGLMALAVWAVLGARTVRVWVLAGLAVVALVLALGNHTPLYEWFKRLVPVIGLARFPVKFAGLAAFVVPLLAAFAVARLSGSSSPPEKPGPGGVIPFPAGKKGGGLALASGVCLPPDMDAARNRRASMLQWCGLVLTALATLLLMAGLLVFARRHPFELDQWDVTFRNGAWRAGCLVAMLVLLYLALRVLASRAWLSGLAGLAVLAVIAFDTATHTPSQNPTLPASAFQPGIWERAFQTTPPRLGEGRLMISAEAEAALLHSTVADPTNNFLGKRLAEWSNLNLLDRAPKVNGSSTLQLRNQMQVEKLLYVDTNRAPQGLMDFLGVSRTSAPGKVVEWAGRTSHLPFITAGQKPVFADDSEALALLAGGDFNPREVVLLPRECEDQTRIREGRTAVVTSIRITAHRIECEVEAQGPTLVVVAQSFYHPWEALVGDQRVPLWRANHAFQALEVPQGTHRVVLAYRDLSFRAGGAVSLATLLGCLLYAIRRHRLRDLE